MPNQGTTADPPPLPGKGCGVFEAPGVGPLFLGWVEEGLALLSFGEAPRPVDLARFAPELEGVAPTGVPAALREPLERYFAGAELDPVELPVRLGGTRFQKKVWTALREVRRGQVRTYAGLAGDAGSPRAMRAVGMAMAANPIAIVVPCHRVVAKGHVLGGYSGGLERKRVLLELEGVRVEGEQVMPGQLSLV